MPTPPDTASDTTAPGPRTEHLDRRTLVRTALWAAPAVHLAAASPAFADSSPIVGEYRVSGSSHRWHGGGVAVYVPLTLTRTGPSTSTPPTVTFTFSNPMVWSDRGDETLQVVDTFGAWSTWTIEYKGTGTARVGVVTAPLPVAVPSGGAIGSGIAIGSSVQQRVTHTVDISAFAPGYTPGVKSSTLNA